MTPLVSVIVPTKDRPGELFDALASLAAQTFRDFEVVVVNDGGCDVDEVLAQFDIPIRALRHERPQERSAARNAAVRAAHGRYIAYLDDDDVYLPDHLETLVAHARETGAKVVYADARRARYRGERTPETEYELDVPPAQDFDRDRLLYENHIPILCVLHEADCLERAGLFDVSLSRALEDWDLWIRLSRHYDFAHVRRVTCEFRERVDRGLDRRPFRWHARRIFAKYAGLVAERPDLRRLQQGYLAGLWQLEDPASQPLTSIVIPTFDNLALTRQCLDAVERTTRPGTAEVVVVDNGSTDGTAEWLAAEQEAGRLRCILNGENRGFAAACNQGAGAATGKYVLFLNNDTVPQPGWLDALVDELEQDPEVGVAGSRLLYPDGTIQHAGVAVSRRAGELQPFHANLCAPADAEQVRHPRDVQMVTGACLVARRELASFDEEYVNGHEDLELCLQARARGFRVRYVPESVVVHLESRTKRLVGLENFHYQPGVENEEARGRRRFLERWRDDLRVDAPLTVLFAMTGWEEEGGGTILPRQIAKALVRRGHRVVVLVAPPQQKPDAPAYHLERREDDGVELLYLWNRPALFNDPLNPEREIDDPHVRALAERIGAELRPDVVHIHSLLGFSMSLREALGAPTVFTSHNYWPICPRMYLFRDDLSLCDGPSPDGAKCGSCLGRPDKAPAYAARLEAGKRALGRHLAVSRRVAELYAAAGHDPEGIHVLQQQPESADWIWARTGSTRRVVERLERPLRVGFIGSLYPHKGAHVLVQAVQAVDGVEAHLFGGGSPAYLEALRGLDGAGRVVFHGGYEPASLPELLAGVDVACVPSVWEDCAPLVVAEALAARAPVVASATGGIPDFVRDGENGFLFRRGDAAALAGTLGRFAADPELLGRLQAAIGPPAGFDSYLDELESHYRTEIAAAARVDGARAFAVLARAGDLDEAALRSYAETFGPADDATLVIHVPDGDTGPLERLVASAGLDGDEAPDLLAVVGPAELEGKVDAVLAVVPPRELRRRAEDRWANAA